MSPEERFQELVYAFARDPNVTPPEGSRGFGSHALRIHGKIFAMVVRGHLVVKLPRSRVDSLVDSGDGIRFDANKGKPMKEWLRLDPASSLEWEALAQEAMAFVEPP
jgi:TfoX/Sxy family transcriptional regulator of competence genes